MKDCRKKMDGWCSSSLQCGESGVRVFTCRSQSLAEVPADCILQGAPGSRSHRAAEGALGHWGQLSASAGVCLQHREHRERQPRWPRQNKTARTHFHTFGFHATRWRATWLLKTLGFYLKSSNGTDKSFFSTNCFLFMQGSTLLPAKVGSQRVISPRLLSAQKSCNQGVPTHRRLSSQLCIWLMHHLAIK